MESRLWRQPPLHLVRIQQCRLQKKKQLCVCVSACVYTIYTHIPKIKLSVSLSLSLPVSLSLKLHFIRHSVTEHYIYTRSSASTSLCYLLHGIACHVKGYTDGPWRGSDVRAVMSWFSAGPPLASQAGRGGLGGGGRRGRSQARGGLRTLDRTDGTLSDGRAT